MQRFLPIAALVLAAGCSGSETSVNVIEPEMAVFPSAIEFGDAVVDYTAGELLTITNTSRAPLTVSSIELTGANPGIFEITPTSFELGEDESQEVAIAFTPSTYVDYVDTISIFSDDPDWEPSFDIAVSGTGVQAPTPEIEVDPVTVDFGDVTPGDYEVLWFDIENIGDAALELGETVQSGSGNFQLQSDPSGQVISPEGGTSVVVLYNASEEGDSGSLMIPSNDPDEPETTVYFIGNGGSDLQYPVAVIDAVAEADPRTTLSLNGVGSYDPQGYEIVSYEWTLNEVPDGSGGVLEGAADSQASLYVDVAGTYEVQLQVTNEIELASAPTKWTIDVVPDDAIHIYMSWNTGSTDMDLHLLENADAVIFDKPEDCCYCNPNPDWGSSASDDDPRLDIDNQVGYGPENINIETPADGEYYVRVHYWEDAGEGASEATVVLYIDGQPWPESFSRTMYRDEVWDVGYIKWPEGVFVEDNADPYEPPNGRGCQ